MGNDGILSHDYLGLVIVGGCEIGAYLKQRGLTFERRIYTEGRGSPNRGDEIRYVFYDPILAEGSGIEGEILYKMIGSSTEFHPISALARNLHNHVAYRMAIIKLSQQSLALSWQGGGAGIFGLFAARRNCQQNGNRDCVQAIDQQINEIKDLFSNNPGALGVDDEEAGWLIRIGTPLRPTITSDGRDWIPGDTGNIDSNDDSQEVIYVGSNQFFAHRPEGRGLISGNQAVEIVLGRNSGAVTSTRNRRLSPARGMLTYNGSGMTKTPTEQTEKMNN